MKYTDLCEVKSQEEAKQMWEKYIKLMRFNAPVDRSDEEVLEIAKFNLGYFIGGYSEETRKRLYAWYNLSHPLGLC